MSVLFQIKPLSKKVKQIKQYTVLFGEIVTNSFRFHCIKLWGHRDDILAGKKEFMDFIPLLLELFASQGNTNCRQHKVTKYLRHPGS